MIHVEFIGPVRKPEGKSVHELPHTPTMTVGGVLFLLGFAAGEARFLLVAVGGDVRPHSFLVADGDCLTVSLPVGGG